jgi:RNA polymerase sigma factor (sigma-70 family)
MVMDLFEKNLSKIKSIAYQINMRHNQMYEIDELVNAAYVMFDRAITNNPALIEEQFSTPKILFYRVSRDMVDYIRNESKFRIKQRMEAKDLDIPTFKTTSFQKAERDSEQRDCPFEPYSIDAGYAQVEIKDYVGELCELTPLSDDEWAIIQGYFYDDKSLKQIGQEIGYAEGTICTKKKKMLKKLLTYTEKLI